MKEQKQCKWCGRLFTPGTKRQIYCHLKRDGKKCQLEAQAARIKSKLRAEHYAERKKPAPIGKPLPLFMENINWQAINPYPVGGFNGLPWVQIA